MPEIWYAIAVVMLTAYVVLDGFDFGAGALHLFVARDDRERRVILGAIGPFWDGNEVWLLAAGGAIFVGFPRVLSAGISGFYFAIFLVIWCLILRGISIEFRSHVGNPVWRRTWDFFFWVPSVLLPVFFGAALGNLLRGVPLDRDGWFSLALFTDFSARDPVGILDWYTVLVGIFAAAALTAHGGAYLTWKTEGVVRERSRRAALRLFGAVVLLWPLVTVATSRVQPEFLRSLASRPVAWIFAAGAAGGLVLAFASLRSGRDRSAFPRVVRFRRGPLPGDGRVRVPGDAARDRRSLALDDRRQLGRRSRGLSTALRWFSFGFPLAILYFVVLFRLHRGKVTAAPEGEGY
jgi:cytochrome d ubiquinol oxidase subunit II